MITTYLFSYFMMCLFMTFLQSWTTGIIFYGHAFDIAIYPNHIMLDEMILLVDYYLHYFFDM